MILDMRINKRYYLDNALALAQNNLMPPGWVQQKNPTESGNDRNEDIVDEILWFGPT